MGMPVEYLREVLQHRYQIAFHDDPQVNETNVATRTIAYGNDLRRAAVVPLGGETVAESFSSVFHEAWHAWLEAHSAEQSALLLAARRYYEGGTVRTETGRVEQIRDAARVVDEAGPSTSATGSRPT